MKTIQRMLSSHWAKLLVVLLVAALGTSIHAAYWNQNRTKTHSQGRDLDGDDVPNLVDPDIDNDGIPNAEDKNVDGGIARTGPYAGQYVGDHEDNDSPSEKDIDDDGLANDSLGETDIDGDQTADLNDDDIDGDGRKNDNAADIDIDGDGIRNDDHAEMDEDGDGVDDIDDDDDNNNGIHDIDDLNQHPEDGEDEHQVDLTAQPAAPNNSSVKIALQRFGTGSTRFAVDARDLDVGNYDLVVAGVVHGALEVVQESSKTRGSLVYKTADSGGGSLLLDFTVAGQSVEVRQGATVFFSGTAPAVATGEGAGTVTLTRSPGTPADATSEAVLHFGTSGATELEVNVEKVPAGAYSVVIGDAIRGVLNVTGAAGSTEGEVQFNKNPSGAEILLNFPVAGQSISLVQGSTTFFFGQLPSAATP